MLNKFWIWSVYLLIIFACFSYLRAEEPGSGSKVSIDRDIELELIDTGTWIHISYQTYPRWGRVPANGLLIVEGVKAVLVDTPWNDDQTKTLINWVEHNLNTKVSKVIVTHAHDDCMGGLAAVHDMWIPTLALELTRKLAAAQQKPVPKESFIQSKTLSIGERRIVVDFHGAGHTRDNAVVWLPDQRILFGGCLVKSIRSKTLGNIKDADILAWSQTLEKVKKVYSTARIVIPGHGPWDGFSLIDHTSKLCRSYLANLQ